MTPTGLSTTMESTICESAQLVVTGHVQLNKVTVFFQHLPVGCKWDWGLAWGHAVSEDLVTWTTLAPALTTTHGGVDGNGCFSGCATVDTDGTPTILYTGVRLKSSDTCGPCPPSEYDLGTPMIETQCLARAIDPDDELLEFWEKQLVPFLPLPPANSGMTAWRDPFIVGRPWDFGQEAEWSMIIGAGIKDTGGSALLYKSRHLSHGWRYCGELCRGPGGSNGVLWECPVLVRLPHYEDTPDRRELQRVDDPPSLESGSLTDTSTCPSVTNTSQQQSPPSHEESGRSKKQQQQQQQQAEAAESAEFHPYSDMMSASTSCGPPSASDVQITPSSDLTLHCKVNSNETLTCAIFLATAGSVNMNSHQLLTYPPPGFQSAGSEATAPVPGAQASCVAQDNQPNSVRCSTDSSEIIGLSIPTGAGRNAVPRNVHSQCADCDQAACKLEQYSHMFSICPDNCQQPALYYIGAYNQFTGRFDIDNALGPFQLDLGDCFYAPNSLLNDGKGRTVLWGWMQELNRRVGDYAYAGCISLPRLLWLHPGSSVQGHVECGTPPPQQQQQQQQQKGQDERTENEGTEQSCSDACTKACTAGTATQLAFDSQKRSEGSTSPSRTVMENAAHMLHVDDTNKAAQTAEPASGLPFLFQEPLPELVNLRRLEGAWLVHEADSFSRSSSHSSSCSNATSHAESDLHDHKNLQPASGADCFVSQGSSTQTSSGKLHQQRHSSSTLLPLNAGSSPQTFPTLPHILVPRSGRFSIPCISGPYLDLELVLLPSKRSLSQDSGSASTPTAVSGSSAVTGPVVVTGLVMHCWQCVAHEECATLLYHWDTGVLEVVWEALADHRAAAHAYCSAIPCRSHPCLRRVGGKLQRPPSPGSPLHLRVLLDYSLLEVFTGGGEVLSTRVYRGSGEEGAGCGLEIVSYGGDTLVLEGTAGYEMNTIWQGGMDAGSAAGMQDRPDSWSDSGGSYAGSDVSYSGSCRSFLSCPGV